MLCKNFIHSSCSGSLVILQQLSKSKVAKFQPTQSKQCRVLHPQREKKSSLHQNKRLQNVSTYFETDNEEKARNVIAKNEQTKQKIKLYKASKTWTYLNLSQLKLNIGIIFYNFFYSAQFLFIHYFIFTDLFFVSFSRSRISFRFCC